MTAVDRAESQVRLTFPAKAEYIGLGRLALAGLAGVPDPAVSDEVLADCKLALTEACTNVVQHAYDEGDGLVELAYELQADRIVIEVSDDGNGFDAEPLEDSDEGEDLVEGGLGLAIIRALADELEISGRAEGGSSLRFAKRFAPAGA